MMRKRDIQTLKCASLHDRVLSTFKCLPVRSVRPRARKLALAGVIVAGCLGSAYAANTITGTVRNQTLGSFAANTEVVLLRTDNADKVEASTRTDSQGSFTLPKPPAGGQYLLRVVHQGVTYNTRVSGSDVVTVNVFDAAPKITGIEASVEIIRVGTRGKLLHVSDMIEVKNTSSPPLTQAGSPTFEVYLPGNAKLGFVLAAGPENSGAKINAKAIDGEPGRYTVDFPLRPGATKFAFNYDLPYNGRATFHTKSAYPLQLLAVMVPSAMRFQSSAFKPLAAGRKQYQVEAASHIGPGKGLAFEISGTGDLPLLTDPAMPPSESATNSFPASKLPPVTGVGVPSQPTNTRSAASATTSRPASQTSRWLSGGAVLLGLCACAFLLWRNRRQRADLAKVSNEGQHASDPSSPPDSLKNQLFGLEIARLRGTLSSKDYASKKGALDTALRSMGRE